MIKAYQLTGTTDSETTDILRGFLHAVRVDITGTTPATCDLTVTEAEGFVRTLVSKTDMNADDIIYPSIDLTDNVGTERTIFVPTYITGRLTISIAQGDADNVVNVYLLLQPDSVSG